ncbi:uncharacterized protein LOC124310158 isoform X1 [Neodiprion virginianus]|uniref:uncharacterized protein LOC124310158 isoform X1 n=2 Tax=Neodiprion virginianus TaxID=2961670 RepID=UPI001EE6FC1D|nr:uncharacterized protein LOC124310158 isoform X1 [Neodiprion virginianus]
MTTPVLSKKQQKKALSGKKAPVKGLRNVLAQPYEFCWPILRTDIGDLKTLLKTTMPAIRRPPLNLPWSHLGRMKKAERQAAMEEARRKLDTPLPDQNMLNSIVIGVNEVTRLLERDDACCVVLESNVEPMLLIKHIVTMADLKIIPVILVPFLKSVMLETIGFACAAIALKKMVAQSEYHHFHLLYKKVFELATNFPRNRPLKLEFQKPIDSNSFIDENIMNVENSHHKHTAHSDKPFTLSTDVYKYRDSQKQRVFVPESSNTSDIVTESSDSNYISIGRDIDFAMNDVVCIKNKLKTRYVDIHENKRMDLSNLKGGSSQLDEYMSLDPDARLCGSPVDQVCEMHNDSSCERKSKILGMSQEISMNFKSDKTHVKSEKFSENVRYKSLKVKRIQGNFKRVKATKLPKKNKK